MKNGSRLLRSLLKVSEKAANIARACRQNEALFELLIQEKTSAEKNPRFFQDFKTLADVLIQETIRHDIGVEVTLFFFNDKLFEFRKTYLIRIYLVCFYSIQNVHK